MKRLLLLMCYLAVTHGWSCTEGPRLYNIAQIDAGQGKVVARDIHNYPYFLSGTSWYRLGTVRLKHVSVGPAGLWGTDTSNRVHKFIAGNFRQTTGLSLQQVDAGGEGQVVGIGPSPNITYCLRSTSALAYKLEGSLVWTSLSRSMNYYSCGPLYGCWGVSTTSQIYYTQRITPTTCSSTSWTLISGLNMRMIEVATDGSVFGLTTTGEVYQRTGISSSRPSGSGWTLVGACMPVKHLAYDLGQLWLVTTSGLLLQCSH